MYVRFGTNIVANIIRGTFVISILRDYPTIVHIRVTSLQQLEYLDWFGIEGQL